MAAIRGRGNKDTELRMMALLRAHGITGWRRQGTLRVQGGRQKWTRVGGFRVPAGARGRVRGRVFLARLPEARDDAGGDPGVLEGEAGAQRGAGPGGDAGAAQGGLEGAAHLGARTRGEALAARGGAGRAGAGAVTGDFPRCGRSGWFRDDSGARLDGLDESRLDRSGVGGERPPVASRKRGDARRDGRRLRNSTPNECYPARSARFWKRKTWPSSRRFLRIGQMVSLARRAGSATASFQMLASALSLGL